MTLIIGNGGLDSDARNYISNVQAADGAYLEKAIKKTTNELVIGCKFDSQFTALKASCLLSGARTLAGALVPLVGTAPTNFNFTSPDYNRKTGLKGNGTTKYLNSNRNNNADPQNNNHNLVYFTSLDTVSTMAVLGENSNFLKSSTSIRNRSFSAISGTAVVTPSALGASRSASTEFDVLLNSDIGTVLLTSTSPGALPVFIFARNNGSAIEFSDARLSFYSIGESLNLALITTGITAYMNTLNAVL